MNQPIPLPRSDVRKSRKKPLFPWDKPPKKKPAALTFEDLDQARIDDIVDTIVAYIGEGKEAHEEEIVTALAAGDDDEARSVLLVLVHLAKTGALELVNVEEPGRTPGRYYYNGEPRTPAPAAPPGEPSEVAKPDLEREAWAVAKTRPCPACFAKAGKGCRSDKGKLGTAWVHTARVEAMTAPPAPAPVPKAAPPDLAAPVIAVTSEAPPAPPAPEEPPNVSRAGSLGLIDGDLGRMVVYCADCGDMMRWHGKDHAIHAGWHKVYKDGKAKGARVRVWTCGECWGPKQAPVPGPPVYILRPRLLERALSKPVEVAPLLERLDEIDPPRGEALAGLVIEQTKGKPAGRWWSRWGTRRQVRLERARERAEKPDEYRFKAKGKDHVVAVRLDAKMNEELELEAARLATRRGGKCSPGLLLRETYEKSRNGRVGLSEDPSLAGRVRWLVETVEQCRPSPTLLRAVADVREALGDDAAALLARPSRATFSLPELREMEQLAGAAGPGLRARLVEEIEGLGAQPAAPAPVSEKRPRSEAVDRGIVLALPGAEQDELAALAEARGVDVSELVRSWVAAASAGVLVPAPAAEPDVVRVWRQLRGVRASVAEVAERAGMDLSDAARCVGLLFVSGRLTKLRDPHARVTVAGDSAGWPPTAEELERWAKIEPDYFRCVLASEGFLKATAELASGPPATAEKTAALDPHEQEERAAEVRRKVLEATREKPRTRFEISRAADLHMDAVDDAVATLSTAGKLLRTMRRRGHVAPEDQYQAAT